MEKKITFKSNSAVITTKGAELKSLVLGGRELMWEGNPAFWGKTSPVLFPAVGGLKNGRTVIDGIEYQMKMYGRIGEYCSLFFSRECRHPENVPVQL